MNSVIYFLINTFQSYVKYKIEIHKAEKIKRVVGDYGNREFEDYLRENQGLKFTYISYYTYSYHYSFFMSINSNTKICFEIYIRY